MRDETKGVLFFAGAAGAFGLLCLASRRSSALGDPLGVESEFTRHLKLALDDSERLAEVIRREVLKEKSQGKGEYYVKRCIHQFEAGRKLLKSSVHEAGKDRHIKAAFLATAARLQIAAGRKCLDKPRGSEIKSKLVGLSREIEKTDPSGYKLHID